MGAAAVVAGVGVAATAGTTLYEGSQQSAAESKATNAQQQSDQTAIQQQQAELDQQQQNSAPGLETGAGVLGKLAQLYGIATPGTTPANASAAGFAANQNTSAGRYTNAAGGASTANPDASFYMSPDYNFQLTQGLKGLTAAGAATNGTDNGATQKAEIQYAGNLASSQYDTYKAGLMGLAGIGSSTAANTNNATGSTANGISSTEQTQGSNLASSYLGQGTIEGNELNNIGGAVSQYGPQIANGVENYFNQPAANTYSAAAGSTISPAYGTNGASF